MATLRPVLALLLAVWTAAGPASALAAGCRCPGPSRSAAEPDRRPPCCAVHAPCDGVGCCKPAGRSQPQSGDGCSCPVCGCGSPATPQPAVPPAPAADELAAQPAAAAVPMLLLPPVTAGPFARPAFAADLPPPDLVIVLSRLTC